MTHCAADEQQQQQSGSGSSMTAYSGTLATVGQIWLLCLALALLICGLILASLLHTCRSTRSSSSASSPSSVAWLMAMIYWGWLMSGCAVLVGWLTFTGRTWWHECTAQFELQLNGSGGGVSSEALNGESAYGLSWYLCLASLALCVCGAWLTRVLRLNLLDELNKTQLTHKHKHKQKQKQKQQTKQTMMRKEKQVMLGRGDHRISDRARRSSTKNWWQSSSEEEEVESGGGKREASGSASQSQQRDDLRSGAYDHLLVRRPLFGEIELGGGDGADGRDSELGLISLLTPDRNNNGSLARHGGYLSTEQTSSIIMQS